MTSACRAVSFGAVSLMGAQRGLFITLEGGEGAGKSTLSKGLAAHLRALGREVMEPREPGATPEGEAIRGLLLGPQAPAWTPLTETLMMYAARASNLALVTRPALARGAIVVCDRFSDSTRAYQGYLHGVPLADIEALDRVVVGDTRPDLTFIVDLDPREGLKRTAARRGETTRYDRAGLAVHDAIRAAFLDIAGKDPRRCVVLDGMLTPQGLVEAASDALAHRFGLGAPV